MDIFDGVSLFLNLTNIQYLNSKIKFSSFIKHIPPCQILKRNCLKDYLKISNNCSHYVNKVFNTSRRIENGKLLFKFIKSLNMKLGHVLQYCLAKIIQ